MSYDLIFWKGHADALSAKGPAKIFEQLHQNEPVDGVVELSTQEVGDAIQTVFPHATVERDQEATRIAGPWFEVAVAEPCRYLHVTCSWAILERPEGWMTMARLRAGLCEGLGCSTYNPQVDTHRQPMGQGDIQSPLIDPAVLASDADTIEVKTSQALHGEPSEEAIGALLGAPVLATLRRLVLDDSEWGADAGRYDLHVGSLAPIVEGASALTELKVNAHSMCLTPFAHEGLTRLTLRCPGFGDQELDALAHSKLPALERLELCIGSMRDRRPIAEAGLISLLEALPQCTSLHLSRVKNSADVVRAILASKAAAHLVDIHLDLLDAEVAAALHEAPPGGPTWTFANTSCPDEKCEALAGHLGQLSIGCQSVEPRPKELLLEVDQTVHHEKFGRGTVVSIDDGGRKAQIHFDEAGDKTLLAKFVQLANGATDAKQ